MRSFTTALRGRQANPHSFFQLRTIWVVTAARKRVAKGDTPTAFFDLRTTRVVTHLRICRHVPPKVRETLRRLSGRVEC